MKSNFQKKIASQEGKGTKKSNFDFDEIDKDADALVSHAKREGRFLILDPEDCMPDPSQPRKSFDSESLLTLQESIESEGQLQPIIVRRTEEANVYLILVGERRWRAISSSNKIKTINAILQNDVDDELTVLRKQISENDEREDVSVFDKASAYQRMLMLCKEKGLNNKEAAKVMRISATTLSKYTTIFDAPASITGLSSNDQSQDVEALYNLSKAHKVNPEGVDDVVERVRNGDDVNIRAESKLLANDVKPKVKKGEYSSSPENSGVDKRRTGEFVESYIHQNNFYVTVKVKDQDVDIKLESDDVKRLLINIEEFDLD